jgi:hypothetical protein
MTDNLIRASWALCAAIVLVAAGRSEAAEPPPPVTIRAGNCDAYVGKWWGLCRKGACEAGLICVKLRPQSHPGEQRLLTWIREHRPDSYACNPPSNVENNRCLRSSDKLPSLTEVIRMQSAEAGGGRQVPVAPGKVCVRPTGPNAGCPTDANGCCIAR